MSFVEDYRLWKRYHPSEAILDLRPMSEDIKIWLEENCGPRSQRHEDEAGAWSFWGNGVYLFKDERHAIAFLLRWA